MGAIALDVQMTNHVRGVVTNLDICVEDAMDLHVGVSDEVILTYRLLDYGLYGVHQAM